MKTTERHQQGRAGDFIVKLKKSTFFHSMGSYFLKFIS